MRVLQVITSLDKDCGGPSRSLPTMCVGLKNINVCCDILTYQSPNPNTDALMESGVKVLLAENETNLWDKYLSQSFVKSLNADVNIIHIHNLWSWPLHRVATFARKNSIPLVWSPRGTLEPWSLKQKKIKKYLALFFYQRADLRNAFCIHATAEEEADNIRKLGFKNPIAVIPNVINVLNYPLKTWVKKKKRILAFLSRIHPKKGIELLLEAWSRMPSEILGTWKVRIAGEGDVEYINHLKQLLLTKYVGFDVEIVGPKYGKEKVDFLHQADMFILPTFSENFGMAIAEAMACGLPVITTTGTPWKVLEIQNIGWYIEPKVKALVETLINALSIEQRVLEEKGKQCRQIVLENYSIETISNNYKLLYEWVVNPSEKRPPFVYC